MDRARFQPEVVELLWEWFLETGSQPSLPDTPRLREIDREITQRLDGTWGLTGQTDERVRR